MCISRTYVNVYSSVYVRCCNGLHACSYSVCFVLLLL